MPIAGSMGAISAASRRNRRGTGASKAPFGSSTSFTAPTLKQVPARQESVISDTVSVDSKPSVLSMFKQQVQETGGFFKKQQQALADKVQKGLKMTSSLTSGQKKEPAQTNEGVDPAWVSALEQMGFEAVQIHDAAAMLGGQPEHMDELLQVLVTMRSSSEPPSVEAPPPSSAAPGGPVASLAKCAAKEVCTEKASPLDVASMPPRFQVEFPSRTAVGSAEYEMSADKYKLTHSPPKQGLSHSAFVSLQQMGFAPAAIDQAVNVLGANSSFEELFDLLLAMGSPLSPPNSGGASSSTDGLTMTAAGVLMEEAQNAAAALVAEMVREELGSLDEIQDVESENDSDPETINDEEQRSPSLVKEVVKPSCHALAAASIASAVFQHFEKYVVAEPSCHALAAASIASAVARHIEKCVMVEIEETVAPQPKHAQLEGKICASPVRGGA